MSGKRVKIAAVGLGNSTCKYLRYVAEHQDIAELVAVVDTDAARFAKVQGPFALPADRCFDSLDSLAESGLEVDACIIGTPDIHHHQMALQAGADILIIKEFIDAVSEGHLHTRTPGSASFVSHKICFQAES